MEESQGCPNFTQNWSNEGMIANWTSKHLVLISIGSVIEPIEGQEKPSNTLTTTSVSSYMTLDLIAKYK